MPKPEYEFHVPQGEWRPAGGEVDGIWEQILSFNPDNGDYTRLKPQRHLYSRLLGGSIYSGG